MSALFHPREQGARDNRPSRTSAPSSAKAGNVFLLEGPENEAFLDEIASLSMGKWKD